MRPSKNKNENKTFGNIECGSPKIKTKNKTFGNMECDSPKIKKKTFGNMQLEKVHR